MSHVILIRKVINSRVKSEERRTVRANQQLYETGSFANSSSESSESSDGLSVSSASSESWSFWSSEPTTSYYVNVYGMLMITVSTVALLR